MTVCSFAAKISYAEERQQNNYPIILVNGFAGWGREEMLGVKYWGGVHDIQEDLKQKWLYGTYRSCWTCF